MADVKNLKIGNTSYNIIDDEALHQYSTMPSPTADLNGTIVEYTGADTDNYKNGYFYKCNPITTPYIDDDYVSTQYCTINSIDVAKFKARLLSKETNTLKFTAGLYSFVWQSGEWIMDATYATTESGTYMVPVYNLLDEYGINVTVDSYQSNATMFLFAYNPDSTIYDINITGFGGTITSASVDNNLLLAGAIKKSIFSAYGTDIPDGTHRIVYDSARSRWKIVLDTTEGFDVNPVSSYTPRGLNVTPSSGRVNGDYVEFSITSSQAYGWEEIDTPCIRRVKSLPVSAKLGDVVLYEGNTTATLEHGYFYEYAQTYLMRSEVIDYGPFDSIMILDYKAFYKKVVDYLGIEPEDFNITFTCNSIDTISHSSFWKATVGDVVTEVGIRLFDWYIGTDNETVVVGDSFTLFIENHGGGETNDWVYLKNDLIPTVVNSLSYGQTHSLNYALSAYQGRLLKDMIDNIGSLGRFLAMWDADTGVARYLSSGFVYQRGDYFIIAQIAGAGGTNYMPNGATYTGPSTTVATDTLYVSDVYYYDGVNWIYMANHARQIAVDEELSTTSKNPVENRVVTAAINSKQNSLTPTNGIAIDGDYNISVSLPINGVLDYNDSNQLVLSYGNGLKAEENQLVVDTDVIQEKLTAGANITIDSDNVISATGGGSGTGLPCLSDVSIKQDSYSKETGDNWLGEYGVITFTTNMDKDTLVSKMNDLYFGVYRSKRQMHRSVTGESDSGKKRKMVLQNDKRFKLNYRLYCWRYYEGGEELNPMSYYYYYTRNNYPTVQALFDANPAVYVYTGDDFESNRATCFNVLDTDKKGYHISDVGDLDTISRYEAGDISTFEPRPDYKDYVVRMVCKEAIKNDQRYFLWSADWTAATPTVYGTGTAETIPEHMDVLTAQTYAEYTIGDERKDLDYYKLNESETTMYDFIEYLYNDTMAPNGEEYPLQSAHVNWHGYPFDYPLTPVRLADCEVLISMRTATYEEGIEYQGTWMKLSTLKDKDFFADLKQVVFRYKYNTAELWLRFSSWQKRCMYAMTEDETGYSREAKNCWTYALNNNNGANNYAFTKRSFARQRNAYRSYENTMAKFTEYVDFNLVTGADIVHGLMSKSTPIRKRLASWHNGVTTLID